MNAPKLTAESPSDDSKLFVVPSEELMKEPSTITVVAPNGE